MGRLSSVQLALCLAGSLAGASAGAQQSAAARESALSRLQVRARAESPSLAARRAARDVADARRRAAGVVGPATLSAEAEEVPSGVDVLSAGSLRVDVARELGAGKRRAAARELADRDVDRAALEVEIGEQSLDAAVQQLVVRASGALAIATRLASEDSLLLGMEEAVRSRFSVGDARYVDVLRLRTERLRVAGELERSRSEARVSRMRLRRLVSPDAMTLGARDDEAAALVDAAISAETMDLLRGVLPAPPALDSLRSRAGTMRLASLAIERAEAAARLVRAEHRPALSGSIGLQRFTSDAGGRTVGPTVGLSMTLPFTARAAIDARLTVAQREVVLAGALRREAETRIGSALAAALDRYETSRIRLAAYDAALLRGAREEREAALASFRTGGMTLLELLDFERALAQAEISRIRSRVDAADALVDLYMIALGDDGHDSQRHLSTSTTPEDDR